MSTVINSFASIDLKKRKDLLLLNLIIDGKTYEAFLDTGSSISVMGEKFILEENFKPQNSENVRLLFANNDTISIHESVDTIVSFESTTEKMKFYVSPALPDSHPILLGLDFCKLFKLDIIFDHDSATVLSNHISFAQFYAVSDTVIQPQEEEVTISLQNDDIENGLLIIEFNEYMKSVLQLYSLPFLIMVSNFITYITVMNDTMKAVIIPSRMYICRTSKQDDENSSCITHESFASLIESNPKYHTNPDLTNEQRFKLETLLESYDDVFANGLLNMEPTPMIEHAIPFTDENQVVHIRPYKMSAKESEILEQKAKDLLIAGIIKPSISPFNNPVLLIKKPSGDYRLVVDLRRINKLTRKQTYPIPRIDSTIDELSGQTWFTSIDCANGYWTIPLKEEDQHKTAFSTAHGHWDWTRMVQGLTGAPYTFASLMNQLFIDIRGT